MKKTLASIILTALTIAACCNTANAADPYDSSANKLAANNVNVKALRDFKSRFNHVEAPTWFSEKNGSAFYFMLDGHANRVYYDKKGRWMYSLLCYDESKLDRDVRKVVKMSYYDQNITVVKELQTPSGLVYVLTLEDKTSIRLLKVNKEGEMEVMQTLEKN